MPEMGAEGLAEVVSIDRVRDLPAVRARLAELGVRVTPSGDIPSVPGLITATFAHTSGEVYNLKLKSESEPIGVTRTHPVWSDDQHDWVAVANLKPGERVRTGTGVTIVESITKRPEPEPVYNIEVDGDHVYRVGDSGTLVHNESSKPANRDSKGDCDEVKDDCCLEAEWKGNLGGVSVENGSDPRTNWKICVYKCVSAGAGQRVYVSWPKDWPCPAEGPNGLVDRMFGGIMTVKPLPATVPEKHEYRAAKPC